MRLTTRGKLILLYAVLVISSLAGGMMLFISYNNALRESAIKSLALESIKAENLAFDAIMKHLQDTSKMIIASQAIQDALSSNSWEADNRADSYLRETIVFNSILSSVYVFRNDGQRYYIENKELKPLNYQDLIEAPLYSEIVEKNGGYVVRSDLFGNDSNDLQYISFLRMIRSLANLQYIGILCINVEVEQIFNPLQDNIHSFDIKPYVCVVKHPGFSAIPEDIIKDAFAGSDSFATIISNEKGGFALAGIKNQGLGIYYVRYIPLHELTSPLISSEAIMLAIMFVNGVVIILGSFWISAYITKLERQRALRNAERDVLMSLIRPHFLYNTLDSINALALMGKNSEVSKTITALGDFYRLSLNRGKEIITLEQELVSVNSYLYIQKLRYKDLFSVEYDIEDSALQMKMPKMIIQPLVENSIYHGIRGAVLDGWIKISARREDQRLCIIVEDNGKGIDPEILREIESGNGVGLTATMKRIQIICGKNSSFDIKSKLGEGTAITIVIGGVIDDGT